MKLFVADATPELLKKLKGIPIVEEYDDADTVLVLPGGLEAMLYLLKGINEGKDVFLYNKDSFYARVIGTFYQMYEEGRKDKMPFEYMTIESQFEEIVRKLEEKKNGKINDGKTSQLL